MADGNCQQHERMVERVTGMETLVTVQKGQIGTLEERYAEMLQLLNDIKAKTDQNGDKLDVCVQTFNEQSEQIKQLKREMEEINQFKWFRTWANRMKDSLPTAVFRLILYTLALLAILHWSEMGSSLKQWIAKLFMR